MKLHANVCNYQSSKLYMHVHRFYMRVGAAISLTSSVTSITKRHLLTCTHYFIPSKLLFNTVLGLLGVWAWANQRRSGCWVKIIGWLFCGHRWVVHVFAILSLVLQVCMCRILWSSWWWLIMMIIIIVHSQVNHSQIKSNVHTCIHLGGERHCQSKVS